MFKSLPFKVLLIWLGVSGLMYVLLLGEAGYYHRKDLENRLAMLKQEIEELETENRLLRENYFLMRSGDQKKEQKTDQKAIILKFDKEERKSEPESELHITGLNQIRVLYWFAVLFGALIALALTFSYQKRISQAIEGTPEKDREIHLQEEPQSHTESES
ncbi:MAG: hypothetical protein CMN76_21300 [Spirochaetaceae bacterium]|nr:hypothetical protein [Spirochaetaceae bacterium]|tara:strand:- start:5868 stop:6347 length:480 start_codon:yes stop_codon:yes gene_type:complete